MTTDNIFGKDILSGDLNTSLVPELGQEDISLNLTPQESSFVDPLNQELSLTEPERVIDNFESDIDQNSPSNDFALNNNITLANIDPLIGGEVQEFQVNQIDVNDTSFAPPQSQLTFQGGFGDYDGGDDVTLEIEDTDGNVVETFKLNGEGQATLYRDEEYQYVFFSDVDETTKVEIDSTSNIKFGDYVGDSLKIETTGSIEGGDIVLSEPDETGLDLKSGVEETGINNIYTNKYQITDLGGSFESIHPTDINNLGQAVGFIQNDGTSKAFFYDDESGFEVLDRYAHSRILGINDSGDVIGRYLNEKKYSTTIYDQRPFYTQEGEYIEPLAGSVPYSFDNLVDINNSGVVAGFGQIKKTYNNFRYDDSIIYDGNTRNRLFIDGENTATAINDLGHVVGFSYEAQQSFIYKDETVSWIEKSPEHIRNWARDINNSGQIVGAVSERIGTNSIHKVFIYSDGVMQIIDKNAGTAGIVKNNDHNQIIFSTAYTSSEGQKPYIYQNGELTNLNDLIDPEFRNAGWYFKSALEINNKGQIIGQASFRGENRGVILSPPPVSNYIKVGNITTFGDTVILQGNEITLTGEAITTQGGEITFDGATTVDGNLIIDSSVTEDEVITDGGDITFTNTLDAASAGSGNLRFKAGTGNILFSETVGGEAAFKRINVVDADIVTANADIFSDQLVRINATRDIVTQNITAENGRVVISSEEKSISALDITSGNEEKDNIVLEAGDSVTVKNLLANELGIVRIASGTILEQDEAASVAGDITTESITGKRIRVESTGNFTATGDAFAYDGNIVVDAKLDIIAENITAINGNVRLISEEKSVTAQDITSGSETEGGNIIFESKEGVTTANLNAGELGAVRITSGEIVENDTETLEDDTVLVGDISTESITGKVVRAVGTGSFTATGDITAHDGRITVAVTNDVNTKSINSLAKSINLISTDGAVTVDGDLNSEKGGVAIHAADDITTQKIRSFNGAVALSSYNGEITVEDDINTVRGGVTIAAKEGVEVARITTGVGEVNIGSGGDIIANGNISTNVGYVNLKAGGRLDVQRVTTNDGYVSLGADSNVEVQSLATNSGAINLVSATGSVAVAGSIDTAGSYVAIEAALEIIASAIEANGGGINLVANSDFGGIGLIATNPDTVTDVNAGVIESIEDLSPEQVGAFSEIISNALYHTRPVGEFLMGALYGTAANNLGEAFEIGQFLLPFKLSERDRRYWRIVIDNKSTAFKLGIEVANAGSIVQGIIEIVSGGGTFLGGAALCTVGAGATFGISCAAGAPAMVTGAAVLVHGSSLIKNAIENDTDANLIDDLLAPQKMASTGGANGADGLAKKIGVSPDRVDRVENALEVLGSKKIEQLEGRLNFKETRFQRDASGQLVPTEQDVKLLNRVLDKSKELIFNVSKAFDFVDNEAKGIKDIDGINDIRATIRQNRVRDNQTQLINDTELNTALKEHNDFFAQYDDRVSGAYANRFGRASSSSSDLDSLQGQGEITAAKDILNGDTIIGNIDELRGIPDKSITLDTKNPDYSVINNGVLTRLAEIKTPDGNITAKNTFNKNIKRNLNGAVEQIVVRASADDPTDKAFIRLDYRQAQGITDQSRNWVFGKIRDRLKVKIEIDNIEAKGIDVVELVEVFYNDTNGVQKLEIKVENGVPNLLN